MQLSSCGDFPSLFLVRKGTKSEAKWQQCLPVCTTVVSLSACNWSFRSKAASTAEAPKNTHKRNPIATVPFQDRHKLLDLQPPQASRLPPTDRKKIDHITFKIRSNRPGRSLHRRSTGAGCETFLSLPTSASKYGKRQDAG